VLMLGEDRWLVVDHLFATHPHRYSLHWLINDFPHSVTLEQNLICLWPESDKLQICMGLLEGDATFSIVRGDPASTRGWRSRYYGDKEPALSAMLETERANAIFWTFFGFDGDSVAPSGHVLDLRGGRRLINVSLADLSAPDGLAKVVKGMNTR
jgi:hypothetical protein